MLFLVILLCTAPRVQGYPSGAGSGACFSELQPGHSDIPSQTISTSPYSINSGVGIYKAGDNISGESHCDSVHRQIIWDKVMAVSVSVELQ